MYNELVKTLRLRAALWEKMYDEDIVLKQAADVIEAIPKTEKTTRWIPVTERLPKEQETVLTWGEQGIILLNWRHDNKWCCCLGDVTHWMPLPEPPKEE